MPSEDERSDTPELIDTEETLSHHRSLLLYVIIIPYVILCALLFLTITFTTVEAARITLAASTILAPLGTLAGTITVYYFKGG